MPSLFVQGKGHEGGSAGMEEGNIGGVHDLTGEGKTWALGLALYLAAT